MRRALALAFATTLLACRQGSTPDSEWVEVSRVAAPAPDEHGPSIVTDGELKSYLPERIGDRAGGASHGSTTRIGDRALSEVSRTYPGEGKAVELRLSDARLSPQVLQAITSLGESERSARGGTLDDGAPSNGLGHGTTPLPEETGHAEPARLVLPGAVGYSRYDEGERLALAQVVIGGRFVASATVSGARGPDEAADALRSVDTLKLARVGQAE
jgi:hypothetical protein